MKPYHCKNKQCNAVLGYASAHAFEVGGIILDRRTVFKCQSCGKLHSWGPVKVEVSSQFVDNNAAHAYNSG